MRDAIATIAEDAIEPESTRKHGDASGRSPASAPSRATRARTAPWFAGSWATPSRRFRRFQTKAAFIRRKRRKTDLRPRAVPETETTHRRRRRAPRPRPRPPPSPGSAAPSPRCPWARCSRARAVARTTDPRGGAADAAEDPVKRLVQGALRAATEEEAGAEASSLGAYGALTEEEEERKKAILDTLARLDAATANGDGDGDVSDGDEETSSSSRLRELQTELIRLETKRVKAAAGGASNATLSTAFALTPQGGLDRARSSAPPRAARIGGGPAQRAALRGCAPGADRASGAARRRRAGGGRAGERPRGDARSERGRRERGGRGRGGGGGVGARRAPGVARTPRGATLRPRRDLSRGSASGNERDRHRSPTTHAPSSSRKEPSRNRGIGNRKERRGVSHAETPVWNQNVGTETRGSRARRTGARADALPVRRFGSAPEGRGPEASRKHAALAVWPDGGLPEAVLPPRGVRERAPVRLPARVRAPPTPSAGAPRRSQSRLRAARGEARPPVSRRRMTRPAHRSRSPARGRTRRRSTARSARRATARRSPSPPSPWAAPGGSPRRSARPRRRVLGPGRTRTTPRVRSARNAFRAATRCRASPSPERDVPWGTSTAMVATAFRRTRDTRFPRGRDLGTAPARNPLSGRRAVAFRA